MSEKPSCQECQAWMEDAFSGELDPALKPRLEAHLGECADCRAVWADFQTLRRGMEVLAETEGPSLRVQNNVLRAAEAKVERRAAKRAGLWSWLLRPATVAFATLLLIAGIGYLGREELQKRKAAEQIAPAIAPQGTSTQEAPPDALSAPPASRSREEAAPAVPAKPKPAAPKTDAAAPKPMEADGRLDTKAGPRMKDGGAPAGELRRESPTPPPPAPPAPGGAAGAASEAAPVPLKSLAHPPAEPKPSDLEGDGAAASRPATIPEAQRGLGGAGPSSDAAEIKGEDKAKKGEKAAAPAPAAEAVAPAETEKNLQQEKASDRLPEQDDGARYQSLLNAAKAKIRRADYAGALEDLLAAQRIRDTREIQDLILLCRSHLRGDG
ncbi:MAG: zf-HC2 domain-containing protein [Deltaproteobacteria bacterium]|nr:zf-HC2 domain-containing protein [Deltaproteobacteria bacterium]